MKLWIQLLWTVMQTTGKGYRRHNLDRTGKRSDRRNDKLRDTNDGYVPYNPPESKLQRRARLGTL